MVPLYQEAKAHQHQLEGGKAVRQSEAVLWGMMNVRIRR